MSKQVRELFALPKNENIYDDFACHLKKAPGRIYLSENHLCYFSQIMGKTTKLVIKFT
jgi:hypothetical protein